MKISVFVIALFFMAFLHAETPYECCHEYCHEQPEFSAQCHTCSCDFRIFAGLIYWTASEAGADNWAEAIIIDPSSRSNDLQLVDFGWTPGFRVGLGYGMNHDCWDTQVYYTWFHTRGKDRVSKGPGTIHSTFLGNFYVNNPFGFGLSGPAYESASIDWTIRYHIFDWELGRNFWVSQSLALRPFIGIKGGWIHQFIHSKWQNPNLSGAAFFQVGIEDIKNNFWGIGPGAGINTNWVLLTGCNHCFSLFGDFSGAMMWGHWSFSDRFKNDLQETVTIDLQDINSGAPMVRVFMGFEWDADLRQSCYRLSAKLGYEIQFWIDQLQFYSFTGGRLDNELTLQGGTFEVCFDF